MADTVFVLVEHPVTGARGQVPIDTVDTWTARGYVVIDDPAQALTQFKAQVLAAVQAMTSGAAADADAAEVARTGAESARDLAEQYRDEASEFGGTNNAQVASFVLANGPTKATLESTFIPYWKPFTFYAAGTRVIAPNLVINSAKVDFTSGAAFAQANWNPATALTTDSPAFTGIPTVNGVPIMNTDDYPNLFAGTNGNLEADIPLNDTTTTTNIRGVNGTTILQATVSDGPNGTSTRVLRFLGSGNFAGIVASGLKAAGLAGRTVRFAFTARAIQNGAAVKANARFLITDLDTPTRLFTAPDGSGGVAGGGMDVTKTGFPLPWLTSYIDVAVPAATDRLYFRPSAGSGDSTRIEFDNFTVKVAGSTQNESAQLAVAAAIAAGQAVSPAAVDAGYVRQASYPTFLANGALATDAVTGALLTDVPLNDTTTDVNWRSINGTTQSIVDSPYIDANGHPIKAVKTTSSTTAGHVAPGLVAAGIAGSTGRLRLYASAEANNGVLNAGGRIIARDLTHGVDVTTITIPNIPSTRRVMEEFQVPVPSGCDRMQFSFSQDPAHAGSGRIMWMEVSFGLDRDSVSQVRQRAAADAAAAADAKFTRFTERPDGYLDSQFASFSKGGVVGTGGKVPVALRFDDWQDQIKANGIITELANRGLFGSIVLCSRLGTQSWNDEVTYDDLRSWNQQYGMEIWCHGTDHTSPYKTTLSGQVNADTYTEMLIDQIVTAKAEIEAQSLRVWGWAHPGVSQPGYDCDGLSPAGPAFLTTTQAGRLVTSTYGLAEFDMTGVYRHLPSDLRYGLGHETVSDGMTLNQAKTTLDNAIAMGAVADSVPGVEFMTHVGNLAGSGGPGIGMTVADWLLFLDYLVTKRDAGLIEIVTPSSLVFADPSTTRRLDLIANGVFELPAPNSSTVIGNWRNVDGVDAQIVTVPDGPGGASQVLRVTTTGGKLVTEQHAQCVGRGIAGQTFVLEAWVRRVGAGVPRFYAADNASSANWSVDYQPTIGTAWQKIRRAFTVKPGVATLDLSIGAASGTVEWDGVHVYVA